MREIKSIRINFEAMNYWDFLILKAENEKKLEDMRIKHEREMQIGFVLLMLFCLVAIISLACLF